MTVTPSFWIKQKAKQINVKKKETPSGSTGKGKCTPVQ
jgi:hypothetical protein